MIALEHSKRFHQLSYTLIAVFFLLTAIVSVAAGFFSIQAFRTIFYIIAGLLLLFFVFILAGFFGILRVLSSDKPVQKLPIRLAFRIFMPLLLNISGLFGQFSEDIRRVYINANNKYILSRGKRVKPEKMLVILPHCLQSSKCLYRIRDGLNDCRRCLSCNIGTIREMTERLGVKAELATGGTSARKTIIDAKPEFVIAVACERDLSSGIMDVRGLPVYGIINRRPSGPCRDTFVDTNELERMIKYFTAE